MKPPTRRCPANFHHMEAHLLWTSTIGLSRIMMFPLWVVISFPAVLSGRRFKMLVALVIADGTTAVSNTGSHKPWSHMLVMLGLIRPHKLGKQQSRNLCQIDLNNTVEYIFAVFLFNIAFCGFCWRSWTLVNAVLDSLRLSRRLKDSNRGFFKINDLLLVGLCKKSCSRLLGYSAAMQCAMTRVSSRMLFLNNEDRRHNKDARSVCLSSSLLSLHKHFLFEAVWALESASFQRVRGVFSGKADSGAQSHWMLVKSIVPPPVSRYSALLKYQLHLYLILTIRSLSPWHTINKSLITVSIYFSPVHTSAD